MTWELFQKKFGTVVKIWAVPAFVIAVVKTLVVDLPQIVRQIPQDVLVTLFLGALLTLSISFASVAVGVPGALFERGRWERKNYAAALVAFVVLWVLQAKFPFIRGALSVFGFTMMILFPITSLLYGLVWVWRKLPH